MNREDQKRYRERANRARRGLLKEKEEYGDISDGAGKRYRAGVFYVLSGDSEKAMEFFDWFESEFLDDIGEPAFMLFWALAAYRAGRKTEARARLQDAMIQNLYMLPHLFGESFGEADFWHSSNRQYPEYLDEIEEFLDEPTTEEREWMKNEFHSGPFRNLRDAYVLHFRQLLGEDDFNKRGEILKSWDREAARLALKV